MGLAQRNFIRIWHQDRAAFSDKGMPPPNFAFVPKGSGYTTTGATGDQWGAPRIINISPGARRALKAMNVHGPDRSGVRFAIEHEFGRYFGPDAPLADTNDGGNVGAGNANFVANQLARARNQGRKPGTLQGILRRRLPYTGQNPQTILFPTAPLS